MPNYNEVAPFNFARFTSDRGWQVSILNFALKTDSVLKIFETSKFLCLTDVGFGGLGKKFVFPKSLRARRFVFGANCSAFLVTECKHMSVVVAISSTG